MLGFYCPDGRMKYSCVAGRYGSTSGLTSVDCSGLCIPGYFCLQGMDISHLVYGYISIRCTECFYYAMFYTCFVKDQHQRHQFLVLLDDMEVNMVLKMNYALVIVSLVIFVL